MKLSTRVVRVLQDLVREAIYATRRTRRVIVVEGGPREELGEAPIFVIGVHRSGTTLVRLILDSHSRIACPPESFFLRPLEALLRDARSLEGLAAMGFPEEQVALRLGEFASCFFERYAASRGKARWADKTPSYVSCLDFVDRLFGDRARYLLVYRHGLDAACSIARIPAIDDADAHIAACGGDRFAGAARYWAQQCKAMRAFATTHRGRSFELRYEDLVREPEARLRPLFEFLGEAWEPAVLRFHEQPHDHRAGLEDRKAVLSRGFAPNVSAWKDEPRDVISRMHEEAGPMLRELGYDDVGAFLVASSGA